MTDWMWGVRTREKQTKAQRLVVSEGVYGGGSIGQDGICGESAPEGKDSTFGLGHIALEVSVRHRGLLAINSIFCTKEISWLCWYNEVRLMDMRQREQAEVKTPVWEEGWNSIEEKARTAKDGSWKWRGKPRYWEDLRIWIEKKFKENQVCIFH